ncbi:hypothetical protein [Moorena sp. SIO4E2]|nr:hypothetical protein [Moorena sp. SIO4E2]
MWCNLASAISYQLSAISYQLSANGWHRLEACATLLDVLMDIG